MPPQETGKQRAVRIPLDYFKHPNRLERWKTRFLMAALVVSLGWPLSGFLLGNRGNLKYARGEVAAVHATWEKNCNACHVDFQPIRGETWASGMLGGDPHAGSKQCQTCHEGPAHHAGDESNLACAGCHRDHRGRTASLIRGFDNDCTQCHANLAARQTPGAMKYANVTQFPGDHPEFRSLKHDPGKLKFNHALHMTPGLSIHKEGMPFTLGQIDKNYQRRYEEAQPEKGANAKVRLDCASCHQTDTADSQAQRLTQLADVPAAVLPARASGQYMQPITYENQCRACHPLTIQVDYQPGPVTVPHRVQPDEMHAFLERTIIGDLLDPKKNPKMIDWLQAPRPFPGRGPNEEQMEKSRALRKLVDERVKTAEKLVWLGKHTCGECHILEAHKEQPVVPRRVAPTEVPAVWLKHALFDHRSHRAVNCRECHAKAYESVTNADVLIEGIDTCKKCHSPARQEKGVQLGGARFDCAECHRYHQGDAWLAGVGSKTRAPKHMLDIGNFLSERPAQ